MASFVDKRVDGDGNLIEPEQSEEATLEASPAVYTEAGRGIRKRLELKRKIIQRQQKEAEAAEAAKSPEQREREKREREEKAAAAAAAATAKIEAEQQRGLKPSAPREKVKVGKRMMVTTEGELSAQETKRLQAMACAGKAGKVKAWSNLSNEKKVLGEDDISADEVIVFTKCKNCEYTVNTHCTKVFINHCEDLTLRLNGKIITATVEADYCERLNLLIGTQVGTLQVEQCKKINAVYAARELLSGYVIWAGCFLFRIQVGQGETPDLMRCDFGLTAKFDKTVNLERTQFKVWYGPQGKLVCDKIIRLKNGFPTTQREDAEYERKREADVSKLAERMGITIHRKCDNPNATGWSKCKPNQKCPCGSGKKYKKCCRV